MENNTPTTKDVIDLAKIFDVLWSKKMTFVKVWIATFVLSCIWILPQPRYYTSEVRLAPEMGSEIAGGGLASIASSFGVNLGGANGNDAIYPMLYPDLFMSPEFIVGLFDIQVTTDDGSITTDYYTYLEKHQKKNVLTQPFNKAKSWLRSIFEKPAKKGSDSGHDPFRLSKREEGIMQSIQNMVNCTVDKKTDVISITVDDQDPLISATLTDSIRERLQNYIISYRTEKARLDLAYYETLADSARVEYYHAQDVYSQFYDTHMDASLQSVIIERDRLENDLQFKYNTYQAVLTQLEAMKAKVQERTPAFTVLQSPTVPIKPSKPKRMIFVIGMLFLASIFTSLWLARKEIVK